MCYDMDTASFLSGFSVVGFGHIPGYWLCLLKIRRFLELSLCREPGERSVEGDEECLG